MKKIISLIFSLIFIQVPFFAQDKITHQLHDFNQIVVIGNFSVDIQASEKNRIVAEREDTDVDLDNLIFEYSNKKLTIKYKGSFVHEIGLHLSLSYNQPIALIEARRGAKITCSGMDYETEELTLHAKSGGKILYRNAKSTIVNASVAKGGSIRVRGTANHFYPTVKAGGQIAAVNLLSNTVEAHISLGGEIICAPLEKLDAKITSGGTISYSGNPEIKEKVSLGGKIEKI